MSCMEPNPQEEWELVMKEDPCTGELIQLKFPQEEAERQKRHTPSSKLSLCGILLEHNMILCSQSVPDAPEGKNCSQGMIG